MDTPLEMRVKWNDFEEGSAELIERLWFNDVVDGFRLTHDGPKPYTNSTYVGWANDIDARARSRSIDTSTSEGRMALEAALDTDDYRVALRNFGLDPDG